MVPPDQNISFSPDCADSFGHLDLNRGEIWLHCQTRRRSKERQVCLASRTTRVSDKLDVMLLCDQMHVNADSTSHQIYLRPSKHALSASIIKSDKIMGYSTSRKPTYPEASPISFRSSALATERHVSISSGVVACFQLT